MKFYAKILFHRNRPITTKSYLAPNTTNAVLLGNGKKINQCIPSVEFVLSKRYEQRGKNEAKG